MSKNIKEDCKNISIYKLREWGYLKPGGWRWHNIYWSSGDGGKKGDINIETNIREPFKKSIKLDYKIRHNEGEYKKIEQNFKILSTKCNYGGGKALV